jgi:hypothetical protein
MMSHHIFQFPMTKGKSLIPLCRGIPAQVYPSVNKIHLYLL